MLALDHFPRGVHQHQVRNPNLAEVHAKRIDPKMIRPLRVARGDVPGHAFVEAEFRKQPERRGQALFAVPAFFFQGGKFRRSGKPGVLYRCGGHVSLALREIPRSITPRTPRRSAAACVSTTAGNGLRALTFAGSSRRILVGEQKANIYHSSQPTEPPCLPPSLPSAPKSNPLFVGVSPLLSPI